MTFQEKYHAYVNETLSAVWNDNQEETGSSYPVWCGVQRTLHLYLWHWPLPYAWTRYLCSCRRLCQDQADRGDRADAGYPSDQKHADRTSGRLCGRPWTAVSCQRRRCHHRDQQFWKKRAGHRIFAQDETKGRTHRCDYFSVPQPESEKPAWKRKKALWHRRCRIGQQSALWRCRHSA